MRIARLSHGVIRDEMFESVRACSSLYELKRGMLYVELLRAVGRRIANPESNFRFVGDGIVLDDIRTVEVGG